MAEKQKQTELTAEKFADDFYSTLQNPDPKYNKWRQFAGELRNSHKDGMDDRALARTFFEKFPNSSIKITDLEQAATPSSATTVPDSKAKADVQKLTGAAQSGLTKPLLGFAEPYVKKAEDAARSLPSWDPTKHEHSIGQLLGATAQVSTGVMGGLAEAGIQLSSPSNIGMVIASLGTKWIKRAPKLVRALRLAASGALTAETAKDLVEEFPQAMDALQGGDAVGFGRAVGKGFADIMLGKEAGKQVLKEGVTGGKAAAKGVKGVKDYLSTSKPTAPPPASTPAAAAPAAAPAAPAAPAAAAAPTAAAAPAAAAPPPPTTQPPPATAPAPAPAAGQKAAQKAPAPKAVKPTAPPPAAAPAPSNVGQKAGQKLAQKAAPKPTPLSPQAAVKETVPPAAAKPAAEAQAAPAAKGGDAAQKVQAIIKARAQLVSGGLKDERSRNLLKQLDKQLVTYVEAMKSAQPPAARTSEGSPRAESKPAPTAQPVSPPKNPKPQGQPTAPALPKASAKPAAPAAAAPAAAPIPPKIVPVQKLNSGNTYHVLDTDPEIGIYKGEQIVYRGTSRGKHSFTTIDPDNGARSAMEIDDSVPMSKLLKVLGEPESRTDVKTGPRRKESERGSFGLRTKTKAQKLAAILEGPGVEHTSQATKEGAGYWVSPEGELTDLGAEGMHQELATKRTGKKNARAAVEGMMGQGWVRVRGSSVEAAESAAESTGFMAAVQQASDNAQGSPIHVQLGGRHVFLDAESVGEFTANPMQYMRRMMIPPPASR